MKIKCERDVLVEALMDAGRVVSNRSSGLPALMGLHFDATGSGVQITGTDLDRTCQAQVEAVVIEDGQCVIPAKLITDIVKSLAPGAVMIDADESEARITAGRSEFVVRTFDAAEYPRIPRIDTFTATFEAAAMADALRQIVRAASEDQARPVLTGVLMSAEEDGLRLVATDSYRLAIRDVAEANVLQPGQSVLVPGNALSEIARLLPNETTVQVNLSDRDITVALGNVRFTSRLIDGKFPDYRSLVPVDAPNRLTIEREPLIEAAKRVKLLGRDGTTPVRMSLRSGGVELSVVNQKRGQATEEIDAKFEGTDMVIGFNPEYLIDGLDALTTADAMFEITDSLKPAVITSPDNTDFKYLLMPVRI